MSFQITWYTTASISIESGDDKLLFDPFIPFEGSETVIDPKRYMSFQNILITHGHIDHISTLNQTISDNNAQVYGTAIVCKTLPTEFGIDSKRITQINPGDKLQFGQIDVEVIKSRHVKFDTKLVLSTIWRVMTFRNKKLLKKFLNLNKICPENNETVAYKITADGKTIVLFGSLSYCPDVEYPKCDILILPFQGSSYLDKFALEVYRMCLPKTIVLDHFDNSFPPISKTIDASKFIDYMHNNYPDVNVILPKSGSAIRV